MVLALHRLVPALGVMEVWQMPWDYATDLLAADAWAHHDAAVGEASAASAVAPRRERDEAPVARLSDGRLYPPGMARLFALGGQG